MALFVYFGGSSRNFRIPLSYSGDALTFLAQNKATIEHGWWWHDPSLGAPSYFNALLFPLNNNVDQAIVWIVSRFTSDLGLASNLAWFVMIIVSGITCSYVFRVLGATIPAALTGGLIFALSPYALYRNLSHQNLVTFLVPWPCGLALLLASWKRDQPPPKGIVSLLVGTTILGFNYIYYAFFGCFFVLIGGISGWLGHRQRKAFVVALLAVGLICTATVINLAPSLVAWHEQGRPLVIRDKIPAESEVYGLKIRHLVSPIFQHGFKPFRTWTELESASRFPLETENMISRLGLVATMGFLVVCGAALLGSPEQSFGREALGMARAGRIAISGVLLATVGGFGSLFSLLLSPQIRAWNRVTPFIAVMSLVPVVAILDQRSNRWRGFLLIAAVLAVGVIDQSYATKDLNGEHAGISAEYRSVQEFVSGMEERLPAGAMVLQLPFTFYLNDEGRHGMRPYEHFKPYLASHRLHWSYPAMSNEQFSWQQKAARQPISQLVVTARAEGFSAILVDKRGYGDSGVETEAGIIRAGARLLMKSDRYAVLDLQGVPVDKSKKIPRHSPGLTDAKLNLRQGRPTVALDMVGRRRGPFVGPIRIPVGEDIEVNGWILLPGENRPASDVEAVVNGLRFETAYGFERPDVADFFKDQGVRSSGFRITIPASALRPGANSLVFRAISEDGTSFWETEVYRLSAR